MFVQFDDAAQSTIKAVFLDPQDPDQYPNQGEVTGEDARYIAYINPVVGAALGAAEAIAEERYRREASGVVVDDFEIETTRDSQALIAGTGLSAVLDPDYRCNFKTLTGFVEIGAPQIIKIAKAVRAHVQACFDREKTLLDLVAAGTYRKEMLAEGWPDSTTESVEGGAE